MSILCVTVTPTCTSNQLLHSVQVRRHIAFVLQQFQLNTEAVEPSRLFHHAARLGDDFRPSAEFVRLVMVATGTRDDALLPDPRREFDNTSSFTITAEEE